MRLAKYIMCCTNHCCNCQLQRSAQRAVQCQASPMYPPVDTSTHTAALLAVPPPQLLLQADQLSSCQRTAWLQAAPSLLQALPKFDARNMPLKLLLSGELLAASTKEDASRFVTASPKRKGACCCSIVVLLLQGMLAQSVALQS